MKYQTWRNDALADVQRVINRTLHLTPRNRAGSRRRNRAGESGSGSIQHPFRVTADGKGYKVAGGYVFGYDSGIYLQEQALPSAAAYYIAVKPDVGNHVIRAEIAASGKKEYLENGVYYFPVAEVTENGIVQHQFGNLVTPFRRNYIPIIDSSLQCLLKVKEGEGDEIKIILQDDIVLGGPLPNEHLCTNKKGDLCWRKQDDSDSSGSSTSSSSSISSDSSGSSTSSGDIIILDESYYIIVMYISNEDGSNVTFNQQYIAPGAEINAGLYDWCQPWGTVQKAAEGEAFSHYLCILENLQFNTYAEAEEYWEEYGHIYIM